MKISAYKNGATAGHSGSHERKPGVRGEVTGWSASAVRRHTRWLYSVDSDALEGEGYAVTLTLRECPTSSEEWHRVRRNFIRRLERNGLVRMHWVVEWQKRGVPHLHCALYWAAGTMTPGEVACLVVGVWLQVADAYAPSWRSQDIKTIDGALGWLQYLSKHASRGVKHYQRQGKPAGWEKTGRLWGYLGEWPTEQPMTFDLARDASHRYRRLVRSWTVADARAALVAARTPEEAQKARRRIKWARGMLRCHDPKLSTVRGVSGWVPEDVSLALVALLADDGMGVIQRDD